MSEQFGKEPDFPKIARERVAIRREIKKAKPGAREIVAEELQPHLDELDEQAKQFETEIKGEQATEEEKAKRRGKYKAYRKVRGESVAKVVAEENEYKRLSHLDERAIIAELGPTYQRIIVAKQKVNDIRDTELRQLREPAPSAGLADLKQRVVTRLRTERLVLERELSRAETDEPILTHAADLVEYRKGLAREGHIAPVPTTERELAEIGRRLVIGKPVFLHGPTGTGKTSLARYAAEHFTGQRAEMVYCNPQTREANVFGKQGIRVKEGTTAPETVDILGPLAIAAREGRVVIFDEFTALPRELMALFKGFMNAKPGDTINITGNGSVMIAPGFQMIFTSNLKSEKNPERQELPPEIISEFEQNNLEITFTPPSEAHDIALARLMDADGSAELSPFDVRETLPNLSRGLAEIQQAYTGQVSDTAAKLTQLEISTTRPGLKLFVLNQRTIENIISSWHIERRLSDPPPAFAEYVDQRLVSALTFKTYPLADRILAAKILAMVGLLRTVTPRDLGLPPDIFAFDTPHRAGDVADRVREQSRQVRRYTLRELAELDPFQLRRQRADAVASDFLPPDAPDTEPESPSIVEAPDIRSYLTNVFTGWYGADKQTQIVAAANQPVHRIKPNTIDWHQRRQDTDSSKFGEYTLNPETLGIDWEKVPLNKFKVEILPADMVGKKLDVVAEYIFRTYGGQYRIPGIEYWKYAYEHPDKVPATLKDQSIYPFFFGSMVRDVHGSWRVPCLPCDDTGWRRRAVWLDFNWVAGCRVVLVEK